MTRLVELAIENSAARSARLLVGCSAAKHPETLAALLATGCLVSLRLARWDRWKEGPESLERCGGMVCRWQSCDSNGETWATTL